MRIPTLDDLKRLTPDKRRIVYENARKRLDQGGREVIEMIESEGLPLHSGEGLTNDDPTFIRMLEIIWSSEGKAAAVEATKAGLPALAGIDPILQRESSQCDRIGAFLLGELYTKHDMGTANAGYVVAQVMRHLGYGEAGSAKCPEGCIAKTGMRWRPRQREQQG